MSGAQGEQRCRICHCTAADACIYLAAYLDGEVHETRCWWSQPDLCSRCDHLAAVLAQGDELAELARQAAEVCHMAHADGCQDCRPECEAVLGWRAACYRLLHRQRRRVDGTARA